MSVKGGRWEKIEGVRKTKKEVSNIERGTRERDRETETETERQRDGQTERQRDRDRQTEKRGGGWVERILRGM